MRRALVAVAVAVVACGKPASKQPASVTMGDAVGDASVAPAAPAAPAAPIDAAVAAEPPAAGDGDCERLSFADSIPVSEASGAAWLARGAGEVIVVSDSGNHGEYVVIDAGDGSVREHGKLPLGGPGDDVEGIALHGDRLWGLTSSGWMRAWRATDGGWELATPAYAIDPEDGCAVDDVNCGRNFEGLCLGAAPDARGCIGWAAAKSLGALLCLRADGDRFVLDESTRIDVTGKGMLADCVISADGALWTGDNLFGGAMVRRWAGDQLKSWMLGVGFPEAMAVSPDGATVYRFSDTGGSPSAAARYRCPLKMGPGAVQE